MINYSIATKIAQSEFFQEESALESMKKNKKVNSVYERFLFFTVSPKTDTKQWQ